MQQESLAWTSVLFASAVSATVLGVFKFIDSAASEEFKNLTKNWIEQKEYNKSIFSSLFYVKLFSQIFDDRILSLRFLSRSVAVSFLFASALLVIWITWHREDILSECKSIDAWFMIDIVAFFIFGPLALNVFPDYISLMKSFTIIRIASSYRSTFVQALFLLLDVTLSFIIFVFFICIVFPLPSVISGHREISQMLVGISAPTFSEVAFYSSRMKVGEFPMHVRCITMSLGPFLYSTILTSIWIMTIAMSTLLIEFAEHISLPQHISKYLDVSKQPFLVIGIIASVTVWPLALVIRLLYTVF